MSEKLNKTREELKRIFTSALKEDTLPWHRPWDVSIPPFGSHLNAISNTEYRGLNAAYLWLVAMSKGYDDHRWLTFKQMADKDWKFNQSAKGQGVPVEYWYVWDRQQNKALTFSEANEIVKKDPERAGDMKKCVKTFTVFNASLIDGIEPLPKKDNQRPPFTNSMLKKMLSNYLSATKIPLRQHPTRCFYRPSEDSIYLPPKMQFHSELNYYSTALHECAHSTGHESRLNRAMGAQGTPAYTSEELRAEIASAFILSECGLSLPDSLINENKAYIQSWINDIEDKPAELFAAIKSAEEITAYVTEKGRLRELQEKNIAQQEKPTPVLEIA